MIELFDTHAHLQEPEFGDDIEAVLESARDGGVTSIVLPAVDFASGEGALGLADRFPGVYVLLGYHPHEAAHLTAGALRGLEALLGEPKVVGVGEIGLDFYRMHSPADVQVRAFETMLDFAERNALPIAVHCRNAVDSVFPILMAWANRVASKFAGPLGVLHYFSEDLPTAERYVELGFLISIHTSITHPRAGMLRGVAAAIPLEKLVIETDSPYGAPQAYRGKRNEPAYVVEAARTIAGLKGVTLEEVASATTANARRLFKIEAKSPAHVGTRA